MDFQLIPQFVPTSSKLCSCCRVAISVLCLFLAVPWVGLWFVVVAFPGHTHLRYAPCSVVIPVFM